MGVYRRDEPSRHSMDVNMTAPCYLHDAHEACPRCADNPGDHDTLTERLHGVTYCTPGANTQRSNTWPGGGRRRCRSTPGNDADDDGSSNSTRCRYVSFRSPSSSLTGHHGLLDSGHLLESQPEVPATRVDAHPWLTLCDRGIFKTWTRRNMLRLLGRCVLVVLIVSCGGLIVNLKRPHLESSGKEPDLAEILDDPSLQDVRLQPVSVKEFREKIRTTKNYYDFYKIFLNRDLPNSVIDEIVNARTIKRFLSGIESRQKKDEDEESDYDLAFGDEEDEHLDEELAEALFHIDEMENSPLKECKFAQPEVVHVTDDSTGNKIYVPDFTVVYRCRNVSGCCGNSSQECGPKKLQVIERAFLVMEIFTQEGGMILPHGKQMVEKRVFINHTECGCRDKPKLPGCDRYQCPFPFTKMRPQHRCLCDCYRAAHERNHYCQGIKDGRTPLDEQALMCIKSGKCLKPECTEGEFNVRDGYCPELAEDRLALQFYDPFANYRNMDKSKNIAIKIKYKKSQNKKTKAKHHKKSRIKTERGRV
ncbi:uncharacterized protein LOC121374119 [Gigantopelta aegis]|uniref:uncharacterized protein LOC121374119 n=1 Tax=Gigantopelta aegis TaxID=1735272 RepID=UPI001B88E3F7|nr:uncharacterized protein LOC121374119 [Gigantopelta aegis]